MHYKGRIRHLVFILTDCILYFQVYPIQKKEHTIDYLREHAHLRPRTDEIANMLRLRHAVRRAFEDYFDVSVQGSGTNVQPSYR